MRWRFLGYLARGFALIVFSLVGIAAFTVHTGESEQKNMRNAAITDPIPLERKLISAAQRGDLDLVKELLDKGADINTRGTNRPNIGRTLLHYAAGAKRYKLRGEHLKVAKLLLARGADVNASADTGYTALHVAAGLGQLEMVDFLLENGADINARDTRGTPLQAAVLLGDESVVARLIDGNADLDGALFTIGRVRVYKPAHTEIVRRLLVAGANPNEEKRLGVTAFDKVVRRGEDPTFLLILHGADVGVGRPDQPPRAFQLAKLGYLKSLKYVFDDGYDPASLGPADETFLHVAGTPEIVEMLISRGLKIDARDNSNSQPLHYAVKSNNPTVTAELLARGAQVNIVNNSGTSPLMLALRGSGKAAETRVLDMLLANGADMKLRDKRGYTVLDIAAGKRNPATLKQLIDRGAKVTARDQAGYTAFYRANSQAIGEALVAAGANPRAVAMDGKTPLHLAANGKEELVDFLLAQNVDVNLMDNVGQTPIFAAVDAFRVTEKLISAGADVTVVDSEGKTPLHHAAAKHLAVVKLLVKSGAQLNIQDNFGNTPLHEAAKRGKNREKYIKNLITLGSDPGIKNLEGKTAVQIADDVAREQTRESFMSQPD